MREKDRTEYRGITDLEFIEGYIERLNNQIDKLPTETRVRFLPCEPTDHERECASTKIKKEDGIFQLAYIETGKVIEWEAEDIEYAQTCADEKWRSNH